MKEIKEKLLRYTETLIDFCKFQIEAAIDDSPAFKINAADANLCFEEATRELNQALQTAIPQWQPIETAPRDGTEILTREEDNMEVDWWDNVEERWSLNFKPTHWMPLPLPPTTTEVSS